MTGKGIVHVVDDDDAMRDSLVAVLEDAGYQVRSFANAEQFIERLPDQPAGCVVSDIRMPGMDGLDLLRSLRARRVAIPVVLITGHGDVPLAVAAMKAGAVDFLEKPFDAGDLLATIETALQARVDEGELRAGAAARRRLQKLTSREREVFELLVAGHSNKEAAGKLGLSPRTVEFHRAHIMDKLGAKGLPELVRLSLEVRRGAPAGSKSDAPVQDPG